jgi:hypothetical protein
VIASRQHTLNWLEGMLQVADIRNQNDPFHCLTAMHCPKFFIYNATVSVTTSQVFRAAQLVVGDARVTEDPMFTSISVSAEYWMPILEVKEQVLLPWLQRKQAEGYALVRGLSVCHILTCIRHGKQTFKQPAPP